MSFLWFRVCNMLMCSICSTGEAPRNRSTPFNRSRVCSCQTMWIIWILPGTSGPLLLCWSVSIFHQRCRSGVVCLRPERQDSVWAEDQRRRRSQGTGRRRRGPGDSCSVHSQLHSLQQPPRCTSASLQTVFDSEYERIWERYSSINKSPQRHREGDVCSVKTNLEMFWTQTPEKQDNLWFWPDSGWNKFEMWIISVKWLHWKNTGQLLLFF